MIFKKKATVNTTINKVRTSPNAYLIDCRTKEAYDRGHISGAVSCPIEKIIEDRVLHRFPDKEASIYIVGSYDQKPQKAVKKFRKMGYRKTEAGGYMEEHHGTLAK